MVSYLKVLGNLQESMRRSGHDLSGENLMCLNGAFSLAARGAGADQRKLRELVFCG